MKQLTLTLVLTSFWISSFAQITLLSSDLTSIGDNVLRYVDTVPTYGPGGAGANQIWDFSNAQNDTLNNTSVVATNTTPYASSFVNTSYAMTNNGESFLYFTHTANNIFTNGAAGDLLGTGEIIVAPFTNALVLHVFPRTFGSYFNDTYAFQAEADGAAFGVYRIRLTHNGHVYDTTDAYGTLITPTGTYDALRVKSTDFTTDVIEVKIASFLPWTPFSTVQDTSVSYSWHAKEEKLAIAEFTYDSIGNPARFVYSTVPPVTTVGVHEREANAVMLYPQPATEFVCLNQPNGSKPPRSVEIYSTAGILVKHMTMNSLCVDVSDLTEGMYIMRTIRIDGIPEQPMKFLVE